MMDDGVMNAGSLMFDGVFCSCDNVFFRELIEELCCVVCSFGISLTRRNGVFAIPTRVTYNNPGQSTGGHS